MAPRIGRIALVTLVVFNIVPMLTILGGTAAAGQIQYGGHIGTGLGVCSSPGSQTVTADRDTYVREGEPGNHGNRVYLKVQRQTNDLSRAESR